MCSLGKKERDENDGDAWNAGLMFYTKETEWSLFLQMQFTGTGLGADILQSFTVCAYLLARGNGRQRSSSPTFITWAGRHRRCIGHSHACTVQNDIAAGGIRALMCSIWRRGQWVSRSQLHDAYLLSPKSPSPGMM